MLMRDNFNKMYVDLIDFVLFDGIKSSPRGKPISELISYQFGLNNPKECLCTIKKRKLNYAFAIIEKMQYLTGIDIPDRLCFYNKNYRNFINEETNQFDGSYSPRIGRQIMYIYNLLKKDPDTRQAVININNETDNHESKDVACTISLQFLLRDNKLNLIVNMRSNDVLWGTPYDVNGFCFLQEVMAKWLGVELGKYYHHNGSTHIYEDYYKTMYNLLSIKNKNNVDIKNPEWDIDNPKDTYEQLSVFWYYEDQFRKGNFIEIESDLKSEALKEYLKTIKEYCIKKLI